MQSPPPLATSALLRLAALTLLVGCADALAPSTDTSLAREATASIAMRQPGESADAAATDPRDTLLIGDSLQLTLDSAIAGGGRARIDTVRWSSSDEYVATVDSLGLVRGRAVGTATIVAIGGGRYRETRLRILAPLPNGGTADSAAMMAPALPPSAAPVAPGPTDSVAGGRGAPDSTGSAELPRAYVELSVPTPARTITVPAGGDLQAALDDAMPGDVVVLAAGATYVGNFVLRPKRDDRGVSGGWITVRTSAPDAALPASGARIAPSHADQLPKLVTPNAAPALATEDGAARWRLLGLEIATAPGVSMVYNLVAFGEGSTTLQTSLSQVPTNLIVERSWIHGSATAEVRRCVALNSAHTAIVDSYFTDCHSNQGDSQAIYGWNGPGPFKITNNYLEGGHEVVGFGGPTPGIAGLIPSDIEIRRNHITRPMAWRGQWGAKNLFECKSCQRVLLEGNVLENNWVDQQNGFAIVLQGLSDGGDAPQNRIWDVTIRSNIIRNTAQGISVLSRVTYRGPLPTNPGRRVTIANNLVLLGDGATFDGDRRQLQLLGDLSDVAVAHNTFGGAGVGSNIVFDGAATTRLVLTENVFGPAAYGLVGNGTMGASTLARYAPGGQTVGNAFVGLDAAGMPGGNWFPATLADAGLLGTLSGDWSISSGGSIAAVLRTAAIGVNQAALGSATLGAVTGPAR